MLCSLGKTFIMQRSSLYLRKYGKQTVSRGNAYGAALNSNVSGLSDKCVKIPNKPVGPGAAKDSEYKNPEYFCYHMESFAEAEVELAKYRLPAPSNKKKN